MQHENDPLLRVQVLPQQDTLLHHPIFSKTRHRDQACKRMDPCTGGGHALQIPEVSLGCAGFGARMTQANE